MCCTYNFSAIDSSCFDKVLKLIPLLCALVAELLLGFLMHIAPYRYVCILLKQLAYNMFG